ncbi:Crp/Fnr family transcriptional regulator [Flavobacteriaceae bacterium AH-315-B10]|nr:Crp/Fnr family transcriptional regulator [Flavobacteriaceae bacterium AH-315-B10]
MNPNFAFLNSFVDISEETFDKLQKLGKFKRIEANIVVAKTGDIPTKYYFLVSGLMRAYFDSECGKIFTKNIFSPISFVASFTALINKKPSKLTYETLTDCKLYEFDYSEIINLCSTDISVSMLYSRILEQIFIGYEKRNLELLSLDATQRYLKLRKKIPNIDDLIPQFQIASFLSITPVQLSRIRKNIK